MRKEAAPKICSLTPLWSSQAWLVSAQQDLAPALLLVPSRYCSIFLEQGLRAYDDKFGCPLRLESKALPVDLFNSSLE